MEASVTLPPFLSSSGSQQSIPEPKFQSSQLGAIHMSNAYAAIPRFSGKLNVPAYYTAVLQVINTLRPLATLRTVATALNSAGFTTPSGLPFTRDRVQAFLRFSATPAAN